MKNEAGRTIGYTSFNMAASIANGANNLALTYDPEHARIQQCDPNCSSPTTTTLYLNDSVGGAMTERVSSGASATWHVYIVADGNPRLRGEVAERFLAALGGGGGSTVSMRYFVLDHLGSVSAIAQEDGTLATNGRLSYDAFGSMRKLDGTPDANCSKPQQSPSTRGYTSQEEMPSVCLVNYNARIYDPQLGRFLSADPSIEAPYNPQDLNRYTYVGNNPLSFNDPSGLCFLGCFWKNPIFVAVLAIAISIFLPVAIAGWGVFTAGTLGSIGLIAGAGALAGAVSAGLTGGNILQGALFGGLTAAAFAGTGALAGDLGLLARAGEAATAGQLIGNAALHGMVGGLISVAEHGSFLSGFLPAGVGSLGGPLLGESSGTISPQGVFVSAALGGVASVLGGGKFQNGAVTAAFSYVASGIAARAGHTLTTDPPLAGKNISITISASVPADEQAAALAKVEAAIDNINQSALSPFDISVLNSINGVEIFSGPGRSGIDTATGIFHYDLLELDAEDVPFISSNILHDSFHQMLFNWCGSCAAGDYAENIATSFQFSVPLHIPVPQSDIDQTWDYIENPQALHAREQQPMGGGN